MWTTRLLRLVAVLLAVTAASFSMISLLPGDFATAALGANSTEEDRQQVREERAEPVVDCDRTVGTADPDVHVEPERVVPPDDVAE